MGGGQICVKVQSKGAPYGLLHRSGGGGEGAGGWLVGP